MQISKLFYFVLILHLILGKVTKFLVEKLSTSEVISQKPHGRWNPPPPPPPNAFRVNNGNQGIHENYTRETPPITAETLLTAIRPIVELFYRI